MLEKLTSSIDIELIFGLLAASGGIARIVTGTNGDPKVSWVGEAGRVIFVAMPVGIIAGMWILSKYNSEVLAFAACFTAGVISLNLVRFLASNEGFSMVKNFMIRNFSGGKNEK
jgi:hypothetical protein